MGKDLYRAVFSQPVVFFGRRAQQFPVLFIRCIGVVMAFQSDSTCGTATPVRGPAPSATRSASAQASWRACSPEHSWVELCGAGSSQIGGREQ